MATDSNCIFCKIVSGEIPAKLIEEGEKVVAFHDVNPMAPTHVLLIPKVHIASVNDLTENSAFLLADMALMAKKLAASLNVKEAGYRLVLNTGREAGQSVFHLHMHLLAGRPMHWPPG